MEMKKKKRIRWRIEEEGGSWPFCDLSLKLKSQSNQKCWVDKYQIFYLFIYDSRTLYSVFFWKNLELWLESFKHKEALNIKSLFSGAKHLRIINKVHSCLLILRLRLLYFLSYEGFKVTKADLASWTLKRFYRGAESKYHLSFYQEID